MGINYAPYAGQILLCDYRGSIRPEMEKTRPVVVLSPRNISQRTRTAIIVPLSTTDPLTVEKYHIRVAMPGNIPAPWSSECWAKCDMVAAVSFARLGFIKIGKDRNGKRINYNRLIGDESLLLIRQGVRFALGAM